MRFRAFPFALILIACAAFAAAAADAPQAARLAPQNVDAGQISVSGISSGAFMANQLHIAHSANLVGAGLVAGGLYGCAVQSADASGIESLAAVATGACMSAPDLLRSAETYAARIRDFAARGWIDPIENLARTKLYVFTGADDNVVNPETVRRAVEVYERLGLPPGAIRFSNTTVGAGHSWVTADYGNACGVNAGPYINNCGYDQSQRVLETIYGPMNPKRAAPLSGSFVAFDQTEFVAGAQAAANGLWHTGYIYVPADCARPGEPACRLHVVFHGCMQSEQLVGRQAADNLDFLPVSFREHIGMNEWADANRIVVLYPQARTVGTQDFPSPRTLDIFNVNPNGCWNWWGYAYDSRYPFKDGVQVAALWRMIQRVAGLSNR